MTLKTLLITLIFTNALIAQNPILPGKGICDPHVRIYNNKVYLYATHDSSIANKTFVMNDWWIWSSADLVNWKYESTLNPQTTYFKKPSPNCWAVDAVQKNGKYYIYFSMGVTNIGVVVADSPEGPWRDPLGKPIIDKTLTPTQERDPGILADHDGNMYIVFGVWDFYIARLNDDMISLAEAPRKIELDKKDGPYGPGRTDDKPYLHYHKGTYYLSWGCYYATSTNLYGPYSYKGSIVKKEFVAAEFQDSLTYDRHASFFEWNNQWYFMCNDQSFEGSHGYFRNSVLTYLHYKANGEIAPVKIDKLGVGRYDARETIQAENYFSMTNAEKQEKDSGGFEIRNVKNGTALQYPNVFNLPKNATLSLKAAVAAKGKTTVFVYGNGKRIGKVNVTSTGSWGNYQSFVSKLTNQNDTMSITLRVKGPKKEALRIDEFGFN
jgi:arabinoxylan arabinofuranohydrolase